MLKISDLAAQLIIKIMVDQGLDPLRDVFEISQNDEGYAISFTRDLAPTEICNGLRIYYRGSPLEIDISSDSQIGLIFKEI